MTHKVLYGLLCTLVVVGVFGRGSWLDPDLQGLRSDYMSAWQPAHVDGEIRFERPADLGALSLDRTAYIERRLGFTSAELAADAIAEALAAADSHGWSTVEGDPRKTATRSRPLADRRLATLTVAYGSAGGKSTLLLRIEVR